MPYPRECRLRMVDGNPVTGASQRFLFGGFLFVSVSPRARAHFEPERLPHDEGSRQLLGPRLEHRTLSDIDGSVEVSVHELPAFIACGGTHQRKDTLISQTQCEYSLIIAPSCEQIFCLHLTSFPSSFVLLHSMVSTKRILGGFGELGDTESPGSTKFMSIPFHSIFYFFN